MVDFNRRQVHILGAIALKQVEQAPDDEERSRGHPKCETPRVRWAHRIAQCPSHRQSRQGRRYESAEGIIGAPHTHECSPLAPREELTDVLGKRRPPCSLAKALEDKQPSERQHCRRRAHRYCNRDRHHHATEDHDPRAKSIAEHSEHELTEGVGREIRSIHPRHVAQAPTSDLRILQLRLCYRKGFSRQVEPSIGEPGYGKNSPPVALVTWILVSRRCCRR